jgi:N-acetylmuramoyl-L-alanine amidase
MESVRKGRKPMAVRAASWALFGLLFAAASAAASAAGPPQHVANPPAASADSFPVATDARLGGDDSQTRFVMDFNRRIDFRAFTLAEPYRVVVDIPQVIFRLPRGTGEKGRGLIKAFRFGLVMRGGSRLVFDLAKPVRIDKAFIVDAADGAPARLVLDFAATDRESFLRRIEIENSPPRADVPRAGGTAAAHAAHTDARPLVVLDPGHGGIDTGAKARGGEMEKDIVLDFAQRLRERIEKAGKYQVLMTRSDDSFVPLSERVRIARNAGAALFVSIHADSLPRGEGDAQGATVYTLSDTASDSEAARLAEKENRADVIAGVDLKSEPADVAGILLDLAQRETKSFSVQFAHKLVGELKTSTRLHKEPVKSAGFRVLRAPDVPSVLVELGYLSNRSDLQAMMSDTWRNRTADTMARAIDSYLATHVSANRLGSD